MKIPTSKVTCGKIKLNETMKMLFYQQDFTNQEKGTVFLCASASIRIE